MPAGLRQPDDNDGHERDGGEQHQRRAFIAIRVADRLSPPVAAALMVVLAGGRSEGAAAAASPRSTSSPRAFHRIVVANRGGRPSPNVSPSLAESTSVADEATHPPTSADLERAAKFTREPFVSRARTPRSRSRPARPRARALDAALAEIDAGLKVPVGRVAAQRSSLLLGLERLLSEEEPHAGRRHGALGPPGRRAVGHADRAARRGPAQRRTATAARLGRATSCRWRPSASRARRRRRRGRRRARGAAGLGRRRRRRGRRASSTSSPRTPTRPSASGSSTRPAPARRSPRSASSRPRAPAASLILTHRRNLVDQFHGELRDRGYAQADLAARCWATRTAPTARSRSRPTSGSCATRARSPTRTRSSSATRRTPRWARRPPRRSASGAARSSSA